MSDKPTQYAHLTFNSPLAPWRAERLVRSLSKDNPPRIIDFGCGWGELLLSLLEASPSSTGIGLDNDNRLLDRARSNARKRGLSDQVEFIDRDASTWTEPADLVICIGASHIWSDPQTALRKLHPLVKPGGRLLFGDMIWERRPTPEELARLWEEASGDEMCDLPELTDAVIDAGFRPLRLEAVERGEMDDFESGFLADWEHYLINCPNAAEADTYRRFADEHRRMWLEGYRDLAGFAYVTAGRPYSRR
ncbi:class I SAM-dependent methyltransferase [Haloglycomyces albus]|uniref:class I SAM-dependent methyltransferase n=1 Tax=Haloglycomyces albus TaxID=526067 RepID=UPI00046D3C62|nr:class I SAM-dependent methyltransferase [Haloglycomyces albus]